MARAASACVSFIIFSFQCSKLSYMAHVIPEKPCQVPKAKRHTTTYRVRDSPVGYTSLKYFLRDDTVPSCPHSATRLNISRSGSWLLPLVCCRDPWRALFARLLAC